MYQYMRGKGYRPMDPQELLSRLNIHEEHWKLCRLILTSLVKSGDMLKDGKRYRLPEQIDQKVISGTLSVHTRGFAFLRADDPSQFSQDVFVPKPFTANAVNGDKVEVAVDIESVNSVKGPEGKVIGILERGRTHIAGVVTVVRDRGKNVEAHVPLLGKEKTVRIAPCEEHDFEVGDRVILEVKDWGTKAEPAQCELSHYLGHISDPSVDVDAAIEEFELRSDFPNAVRQAAMKFGSRVTSKDMKDREDLRDLTCITIDPDTAKDFDDALSLTVDKKGHYHLGVHIADVSHYVKPGNPLDKEAQVRCNSTYFPGICIPMLPPELSNHLCSLRPNVNRLAASTLMELDPEGNLVNYRITRSVIRSCKRFTYRGAKRVLEGKAKSPHAETLQHMVDLCLHLKKLRRKRGSVELALPDSAIMVDDNGAPQGIDWIEYDITHQLVEEFMLKANELIARHLDEKGQHLMFRVHDEPAEDNMRDFANTALTFGHKLPDEPNGEDIQKLFDKIAGTPAAQQLSVAFIRSMQLAIYSPSNIGHYGLSLEHYCHFTSPIRRYVDLVVHRILFGDAMEREELQEVATRCTEQERTSARAEQAVALLKKLRLLQTMDEKDPDRKYEATISGVKQFGVFFELKEFLIEGFIHISQLGSDYFHYDQRSMAMIGERSGRRFSWGDPIEVKLQTLNLVTLESEWELASNKRKAKQEKKHGHKGKRRRRR